MHFPGYPLYIGRIASGRMHRFTENIVGRAYEVVASRANRVYEHGKRGAYGLGVGEMTEGYS